MFSSYPGVYRIIKVYWSLYGGWWAQIKSPYLHLAILITLLCRKIWTNSGWWEMPLEVLPGIVSFTLAGFALLMVLGDDRFHKFVTDKDHSQSNLLNVSSTFVHFIIVQTIAILFAVVAKSRVYEGLDLNLDEIPVPYGHLLRSIAEGFWFVGFLTFTYSLTSVLSAAFALFRFSRWFNDSVSTDNK